MDPNMVAIKIGYNGELHRQRVHLETFSLSTLRQLFSQTFQLVPGSFVIHYLDADADLLNVCSEAEFVEACRVLLAGKDEGVRTLKFTAELRPGTDAEHAVSPSAPALPLVEAVDHLAQSLELTLAQLRTPPHQTPEMEHAAEALRQAARDTQRTLEHVRRETQADAPLEQVLDDSSEGLKSAARGISTFAQRIVSSFMTEKKGPEANPVPVPAPAQVQPPVEPRVEPPKHQAPPAAAPEVAIPAPVPQVHEEPPAEAAAPAATPNVAFSDAEAKWSEQLTLIRSVLPNVDTALAVSVLERTDGNVEVAVNHLMEQV